MNKLLIIGPASVHISSFLELVKAHFNEIVFVSSETFIENDLVTKQYQIDFKSINPFKIKKSQKLLNLILEEEKPDVVHVHQVTRHAFFSLPIIKQNKIPIVLSAWGTDVLVMPKRNFIFKRLVQSALMSAHVVLGDSNELIDEIVNLGRPEHNHVVMFGIDPIPSGAKEKIIYSNRLHKPLYNIDVIIELFVGFSGRFPDWKLIIGAVGEETKRLKALVTTFNLEDKVEFVGWLTKEDNIKNYQKASIYISIPKSDGTAVSLLEAMSAGCIPVVPDLPVSKEWIENGVNGIIYDGSNPFEKALDLNPAEVAEKNNSIIEERGTKKVASNQLLEIYKTLVN